VKNTCNVGQSNVGESNNVPMNEGDEINTFLKFHANITYNINC